MALFDSIKTVLKQLDDRDFYIYIGAAGGVLIALLGLLFYWHYSSMKNWENKLKALQKDRIAIKKLLTEKITFDQERQALNDKLQAEPDFKIRGYYEDLITKLQLKPYVAQEPSEPTTQPLEGGTKGSIITLIAQFNNITTKQLTSLLSAVETSPRVYVRKMVIDKVSNATPKLNVTLELSTIVLSTENE